MSVAHCIAIDPVRQQDSILDEFFELIHSLAREGFCYAGNTFLGKRFGCSIRTVQNYLDRLETKNRIRRVYPVGEARRIYCAEETCTPVAPPLHPSILERDKFKTDRQLCESGFQDGEDPDWLVEAAKRATMRCDHWSALRIFSSYHESRIKYGSGDAPQQVPEAHQTIAATLKKICPAPVANDAPGAPKAAPTPEILAKADAVVKEAQSRGSIKVTPEAFRRGVVAKLVQIEADKQREDLERDEAALNARIEGERIAIASHLQSLPDWIRTIYQRECSSRAITLEALARERLGLSSLPHSKPLPRC